MQDPRVLANSVNLQSYRAWELEGYRRSGFVAAMMTVPALAMALTLAAALAKSATGGAGVGAVWSGAVFAIYLVVVGGLMLVSMRRLSAWRRAHAWSPPVPARP